MPAPLLITDRFSETELYSQLLLFYRAQFHPDLYIVLSPKWR